MHNHNFQCRAPGQSISLIVIDVLNVHKLEAETDILLVYKLPGKEGQIMAVMVPENQAFAQEWAR